MNAVEDFVLELLAPLWILLTPYVSAYVFCVLCFAAFLIRRRISGRSRSVILAILAVLGCYVLFNVSDFIRYRNTGLTVSPINRIWFFLFFAPPDLYKPYVQLQLSPVSNEYQVTFSHVYGGMQTVKLGLVNNTPKKIEYGKPDELNLKFRGNLRSKDMKMVKDFNVAYTNYYLSAGTNYLPIYWYEIENVNELRREYEMKLEIGGDIASFFKKYPGSFLAIGNGTTK